MRSAKIIDVKHRDSAIDRIDGSTVPITFSSQHLNHLPAPSHQCHQLAGWGIRQRSSLRLNDLGKMGQYSSVDRVGLR
jgi:hypothetical protein